MKKIFYTSIVLFAIALSSTSSFAQGRIFEDGNSIINRPWSPQAKTAVIGAGGGAVLGALLSRDHSQGALIGALLGGGAGYLYGKEQTRRYDRGYANEPYGYQERRDREDYYRDQRNYSAYRNHGRYNDYRCER